MRAPGENSSYGMVSLVKGAKGGVATSGVTSVVYTDLKQSTFSQGGVVVSLKGGTAGLSKTAFTAITQNSPGVPGSTESGDGFGSSLATGDVTGDGYADVLVGAPGEGIGSTLDAIVGSPGEILDVPGPTGSVTTFTGSGTTLLPTGAWNPTTVNATGNDAYVRCLGGTALSF